ncbi:MAG: type VI secretion system tip protein VgrG [Rhizomicrobium sp.]
MSGPSPTTAAGALSTFSIKSGGSEIDSTIQVYSIDTWSAVGKVPKARIVILDGDVSEENFPVSSAPVFIPGKEIEIAAGYDNTNKTIFKGVVVKQSLEIDTSQSSRLVVDVVDKALKMTLSRKNAIFEKITDGDLIGKLISANGLTKDVGSTAVTHEDVVQFYCSDWDLMMTRAEMNGFVVVVDAGKVTVKAPDTGQSPVLTIAYGDSILDLQAEMNAATQYASSAIASSTWDPDTQKLVSSGPGTVSVTEAGNLSSAELAKVFDIAAFPQQTNAPIEKDALKEWSSGELLKSKLSKIRGRVRFNGSALAKTGTVIALDGLGTRFNGNVYVGGVHHGIADGLWTTTADFGLSATWFAAEAPDVEAPGAAAQLPAVCGLQTGIVKKVAADPAGEFRVEVSLPLLKDDAKGVWARLSGFYASNKVGAVFYPEIGDEVVVGFMNDDPRYPVILGSVYSKKLAPPVAPDEKNNKKVLVTRTKMELTFDEENQIIEIKTPGKNVITLSDKGKSIAIKDGKGNSVTLSESGIDIASAAKLSLSAKGDVTIDAKGNLKMTAAANVNVEGLQIAHKAKTKFAADGAAQAELTSSAMVTVKGALVKIN